MYSHHTVRGFGLGTPIEARPRQSQRANAVAPRSTRPGLREDVSLTPEERELLCNDRLKGDRLIG
eukprot:6867015-Prymnesium_polylepis.1